MERVKEPFKIPKTKPFDVAIVSGKFKGSIGRCFLHNKKWKKFVIQIDPYTDYWIADFKDLRRFK